MAAQVHMTEGRGFVLPQVGTAEIPHIHAAGRPFAV